MITLKAEKREVFGKQTKRLRRDGLIPAELYGRGIENIHLSIPAKDFVGAYEEAGEHSVLQIEVDGKAHPVLIQGVIKSPIKSEILAIDFHEIRMDEKVKAHVPLEFEGEAPAVKEKEGILIKNMDEIEVEALPADLPKSIKIDLSGFTELDQSIYVRDLPKSDKFEFMIDGETAIVSVTAPKEEEVEEAAPAEGVPTEEGAVPESAEVEAEAPKESKLPTGQAKKGDATEA